MATIVLVHGGFHGGWCWVRVAERLRARGHQVFTPTLTGLGERAHLCSPTVNLSTHIQDVLGVLRFEKLEDVILCGHSYGGMVITGVADQAAERLMALVYVDAFVPSDGQSMMDIVPEAFRSAIRADVARNGKGQFMSIPPAEVFDIEDAEDRAWVDQLMTPHPFASCSEGVRLSKGAFPGRKVFVQALKYRRSQFGRSAERFASEPNWRVHAVDGGHDLMIDQPEALAAILHETASQ